MESKGLSMSPNVVIVFQYFQLRLQHWIIVSLRDLLEKPITKPPIPLRTNLSHLDVISVAFPSPCLTAHSVSSLSSEETNQRGNCCARSLYFDFNDMVAMLFKTPFLPRVPKHYYSWLLMKPLISSRG